MTVLDDMGVVRPAMFSALTGLSVAMVALFAIGLLVDGRMVGADPAWTKPMKFAVSLVVLFATLALVVDRLSPGVQGGTALRIVGVVMAVCMLGEMAYIAVQAGRGLPSHFYVPNAVYASLYTAMAVGATGLVMGVAAVGWLAWRDAGADLGPGLREGVLLGFTVFALPLLVVAFSLGGNGGHHVGVHPEGGAVLPLFGWSLVTGDLRPAHFLALHAMQAIPLAGLLADRIGAGAWPLRAAAAAWLVLTLAVWVQALAGRPLVAVQ
ncbi:MAG: hypothetical protein ACK4OP_05175 [Gemmobacter sp.]